MKNQPNPVAKEAARIADEIQRDPVNNPLFDSLSDYQKIAHLDKRIKAKHLWRVIYHWFIALMVIAIIGLLIYEKSQVKEVQEPVYQDEKTVIYHDQDLTDVMISVHYEMNKHRFIYDYLKWEAEK